MVHGAFGEGLLVARMEGHSAAKVGDTLTLHAKPDRIYFFDGATGKRLRAAR